MAGAASAGSAGVSDGAVAVVPGVSARLIKGLTSGTISVTAAVLIPAMTTADEDGSLSLRWSLNARIARQEYSHIINFVASTCGAWDSRRSGVRS